MRNISIPKSMKFPNGKFVSEVKEMRFFNDKPVSFIKKNQLPFILAERDWLIVDLIQTSKNNYILTLAK